MGPGIQSLVYLYENISIGRGQSLGWILVPRRINPWPSAVDTLGIERHRQKACKEHQHGVTCPLRMWSEV